MNGDEKTAALIAALEVSQKAEMRAAVDALIALAERQPALRVSLEQSLGDAHRQNAWALAYVLGHLPQPSAATIRALLAGLDHSEPDIRWAIALLLVRLAKSDGTIARFLSELCRSGGPRQKRMAVYCIRDLKMSDAGSLEALLAASRDSQPAVRIAAAISLKTLAGTSTEARQRLLELFLCDSDIRVCNAAAITLAQTGAPSEEFLAALRAAEQSHNPALTKAARAALNLLENKRPASSDG
jgi:hypothetical protein